MRPQILNPAKLAALFRAEFELCNVRPGETITVLSDLASRREYVAAAFAAGTDLAVHCGQYPVMAQYGCAEAPGRFDHWGAGMVHTFPNEGSAHGVVVLQPGDIVVLPYCRYVHDEVRLHIAGGFIRKIEGGLDAKLMTEWLDDNRQSPDDLDGHAVSHPRGGLNPQARS